MRLPRRNDWLWLVAALAVASCEAPASSRREDAVAPQPSEQERVDDLRALPYLDFAARPVDPGERDGVVLLKSELASPGYSLYTVQGLCRAELVDLRGRVVRTWTSAPCRRWAQSELLPDGSLLVVALETESKRFLAKFAWEGGLLWRRRLPVHHDVELTPAGRLLALTLDRRKAPLGGVVRAIDDNRIALLDEQGRQLESVSLLDLLGAEPGLIQPVRPKKSRAVDLLHANAIEWMPHPALVGTSPLHGEDSVLFTMRHQDLIGIVDWSRRRLVWRWGRGEIHGPHDATWLENGHLLVYDNGLGRDWSRIVEVDPASGKIVWQYRAEPPESFFSFALGGAQRLPNGNTLIADSFKGEAFEVTPGGETVWKFATPYKDEARRRATIVRMKRYDPALVERLLAAPGGS